MRRKILMAFFAALFGLAVGAITVSLIGTIKLMLTPGIQYSSPTAFLHAPLLFMEGLLWSILGGALFVLPLGFFLLAGYAMTFRPERAESRRTRVFTLGLAAALWAPVFFFGFRTRPVDAILLAVAMALGVWTSLRFLNRRLCFPSNP
jgi:hypothetical protein